MDEIPQLPPDGERLITEFEGQIVHEHLHRYALAKQYVEGKDVLDIACGEGYGSNFLSLNAKLVVGVDSSRLAIAHAQAQYQRSNLSFTVGSCTAIPLPDNCIDVIISFETLEHFIEHDEFMTEIKRILRPDGLLIISSPDKKNYSDRDNKKNPFHLRELYHDEFKALISANFKKTLFARQLYYPGSLIELELPTPISHISGDYLTSNYKSFAEQAIYSLAFASEHDLPVIKSSLFQAQIDNISRVSMVQLFIKSNQEFTEENSIRYFAKKEQRVILKFTKLQRFLDSGKIYLRLDPGDAFCRVDLHIVELTVSNSKGEINISMLGAPHSLGNLIEIDRQAKTYLCTSNDPQFFFNPLEVDVSSEISLTVEITIITDHRFISEKLDQLQSSIGEKVTTITKLQTQLEQSQATLANSRNELSQSELSIAEVRNQLDAITRAHEVVQGQLEAQLAEITSYQNKFAEKEGTVTALQAQLEQNQATLANSVIEITQRDSSISEVRNQLTHQEAIQTALLFHLSKMTNSFLWKLLLPMRIINQLFQYSSKKDKAKLAECSFNLDQHMGQQGLRSSENPIQISGWFVDSSGRSARVVQARVGDRIVFFHKLERPDVVSHFKAHSREISDPTVGFALQLRTGRGLKLITIEVLTNDGQLLLLQRRLRWMTNARCPLEKLNWDGDDANFASTMDVSSAPVPDLRAIAFYLPQYHAIPENNRWWGNGFTEWTNVRPAKPQFNGHYQPHVPHPDFGYYNLNDPEILEKQARLARAAGIYGFCFYYYWFAGKRLLEMPLERLLASGKPEIPFCYCWANENWSRRWDGQDTELLISQLHSSEDNDAVIRDLMRAFRDSRYIRVNGRPMLVIYRPALIPNAANTFARWREICRQEGVGEVHLVGVKGHGCSDIDAFGLDALLEFPPNDSGATQIHGASSKTSTEFAGKIYDYREVRHLCLQNVRAERPLYRGIMPSWDNTARRKNKGSVFINSSPGSYFNWFNKIAFETRAEPDPENRLLFINAWNEWAEGCHLEPDLLNGYAWLNATRSVLGAWPDAGTHALQRPHADVLVLSHDAERAGAQIVLLAMLKAWKESPPPFTYRLVCMGSGPLLSEFEQLCPTMQFSAQGDALDVVSFERLTTPRPAIVLANTVVHGPLLQRLAILDLPIITYCHELQKSIERWAPGVIMSATLRHTTAFLAASDAIARNLRELHSVSAETIQVVPASINIWTEAQAPSPLERHELAIELGIPKDAIIVFGVGTTDWRKGADLFVDIATLACSQDKRIHFIWIGGEESYASEKINQTDLVGRISFIGARPNARRYLYTGHIFALTSREDPCPLVALEAANAGLPVVCFADAGDIPTVLGPESGAVVPLEDTHAFARSIIALANNESARKRAGGIGAQKVATAHDSTQASVVIASAISHRLPSRTQPLVSVIIPNYNHSKYLGERLRSVAGQTLRDTEIILLDDASTDDSRDILTRFAANEPRARFIPNATNSGSTFKQWRKGLREARGKYIWIAESDDSAELNLLERLVARLESDPSISLACCQLCMMDINGNLGSTPDEWFGELHPTRWKTSFVNEGRDEILSFLTRKNTILNASGVVFRNFENLEDLVDDSMRLCADWLFWARLLARGMIAYDAEPLNHWRLQSSNARTRPPGELEWFEGARVLREIAELIDVSPEETAALLQSFAVRCKQWRKSHSANAT